MVIFYATPIISEALCSKFHRKQKYIYWVGINTKTAKTAPKLPKLGTYLEMYPVLAFIPVYLPKLTELIGTQ